MCASATISLASWLRVAREARGVVVVAGGVSLIVFRVCVCSSCVSYEQAGYVSVK